MLHPSCSTVLKDLVQLDDPALCEKNLFGKGTEARAGIQLHLVNALAIPMERIDRSIKGFNKFLRVAFHAIPRRLGKGRGRDRHAKHQTQRSGAPRSIPVSFVFALSKRNQVFHPLPEEKALQMMDAPGGTDMLGTDIRAIKFHVTPVDPIFIGDLLESPACQVPGVSNQAEGPIQAHGSDIFRIPVHHRAGRDTGPAGNALRVQTDGLPLLRGRFDLARVQETATSE